MSNETKTKQTKKTFTITQICREHALNPKIVRSKLRRLFNQNDDARALIERNEKNATHRYTYDVKLRKQMCELLNIDDTQIVHDDDA